MFSLKLSESFWVIHYSESVRESFVHESDSTIHTVVIRLIQIVTLQKKTLFVVIYKCYWNIPFDHFENIVEMLLLNVFWKF